jgi:radical SAM superfamily enzyme YgiQ (UPF0313 family)
MKPLRIALGDLSYLTEGNAGNLYVPLNLGYVASYAKARFGRDIDVRLFKDPKAMLAHVREARPDVIGLSCYYWQDQLNRLFVRKARSESGYCPTVIMGGPSIDSDPVERKMFLRVRPGVDHVVVNEGEEEFAAIVGRLLGGTCSADDRIDLAHPERAGLKTDLDTLPSPYLDGTLDEFLSGPFQPMIQTSRLCPYTCLAGDTPINTIYGDISIRDLVGRYGDAGVPVYTYDPDTREAFIADSILIRKYGEDRQLVRVHFDDGTHIDCTPDHLFLQFSRGGQQWECEASNLPAGAHVRTNGRKSRIAEINHRVVRVEWLVEKGDVYCLTVPATGWFFANNVLVKNCSFCVSGKNVGKLRAFPMEQVEAELRYISRRFTDRPDMLLYIVDENFGILKRDVEIAALVRGAKDSVGYPNRVFYYNDKRFTQTSRDVQEVLGDMCHHGVTLSLQSENPETLKAIKRRNLTDDDIRSAIAWAHGLGLTVSTELIFGLPHETRASFFALLDKCARLGFDKVQCYNLIIFDGIEMNRRKYRDEHQLRTAHRPIASHAMDLDGDACAESEEVVISSSSISFNDYRAVRAMNVMFHAVFVLGLRRELFRGLVASGASLTGFLSRFLSPTGFDDRDAEAHRWFLADLDREVRAEVDGGTRQCVKIQPVFAKRLSDNERGWAGAMIDRLAREVENEREAAA